MNIYIWQSYVGPKKFITCIFYTLYNLYIQKFGSPKIWANPMTLLKGGGGRGNKEHWPAKLVPFEKSVRLV